MTDLTPRDPADVAHPFTQTLAVQLTGRQRLSVFLRPLYAIVSHIYVTFFLGLALAAAVFAWLIVLVTGRYPPAIYEFNVTAVRMTARHFSYLLITHDLAPPLHGDPDDSYPLRLELPPQRPQYDRRAVALRPLRAIPVLFLAALTYVIGTLYAVLGTFVVLFTGQLPAYCAEPLRDAVAAVTRMCAYVLLTQDDPPALRAS